MGKIIDIDYTRKTVRVILMEKSLNTELLVETNIIKDFSSD